MHYDINQQYSFNYGWKHYWCEPNISKNYYIKEVVKGPFAKPQLVNSIPYVAFCQHHGSVVRLSQGIPDCWAEYLSHNFKLHQNYELMPKKDAQIVPGLRKSYRLYLGPGIPNPWAPYYNNFDLFAHENLENLKKHFGYFSQNRKFRNNLKKNHCICCTRKYLFKCPDTCDNHSCCSLENCPGSNAFATNCREKCRKIKAWPNRLLKKANLKYGKKNASKESSGSSSASDKESSSDGDDESENLNEENESCCQRNRFSKERQIVCSCPYVENFYLKKNFTKNDNGSFKCPGFVSKLIQAELKPVRSTKSVQTDISDFQSNTKCFWCNVFQFNPPWSAGCKQRRCEIGYPPICTIPSFCLQGGCPQNQGIVCPYSFPNHFITHYPQKKKSCGLKKNQSKKKQVREKESKEDLNSEIKSSLIQLKENLASERNMKWDNIELTKPNYDVLKSDKNICSHPKLTETFDSMKYLNDDRFKYYPKQRESSSITQSKFVHDFKSTNFDKGNSTIYNPARIQLERFKPFSHSTPVNYKSYHLDKKISPRERTG